MQRKFNYKYICRRIMDLILATAMIFGIVVAVVMFGKFLLTLPEGRVAIVAGGVILTCWVWLYIDLARAEKNRRRKGEDDEWID